MDIPQWVHFVSLSAASQSRICGQRPEHVPGHVDLGNHLDIALCGVGHDVADVVLGVETSVGSSVVAVTAFVGFVVSSDDGLFAYGPDLCQEGIPFDLDAPSLVLGEVPVELVEFVHGENVDKAFHLVHGPEMASGIEHSPAMREAGFVGDFDGGDGSVGSDELAERLQGVEYGLRGTSAYADALGRDRERVFFGLQRIVYGEGQGSLFGHGQAIPDDGLDVGGEHFGGAPEFGKGSDRGFGGDAELSLSRDERFGARNDVDVPGAERGGGHQGGERQKNVFHRSGFNGLKPPAGEFPQAECCQSRSNSSRLPQTSNSANVPPL